VTPAKRVYSVLVAVLAGSLSVDTILSDFLIATTVKAINSACTLIYG
jgi:hypothetical protein